MADEQPAPPPCAFGAEISESRQKCAVGKAYRSDDGRLTIEVIFYDSPAGAAAFIAGRFASDDPVAVALDPHSQSGTLARPLRDLGVTVTRLSSEDVAVAHGEFRDLADNGGLRHLNQKELTAAVQAGQARSLAGAQAWERRVTTDQAPLSACTFAAWALLRYEELASPGAWQM